MIQKEADKDDVTNITKIFVIHAKPSSIPIWKDKKEIMLKIWKNDKISLFIKLFRQKYVTGNKIFDFNKTS